MAGHSMRNTFIITLLALCTSIPSVSSAKSLIPTTCFDSQSNFNTYFDYNYPWGNTHNGAARMNSEYCSLKSGYLTETSVYSPGQPSATFSNAPLTISYLSCTVYAKQTFTVESGGGFDFSADFIAPTVKGTWPAFWLTAVSGWPPEIDMAEWKGNGDISFNTFNTSSDVTAVNLAYSPASSWHTVKAEIRDEAGSNDVSIAFYLDGTLHSTQYASDYVAKALYLIIDFQMEGSSGWPGPSGNSTYSIRNLEVTSYNP